MGLTRREFLKVLGGSAVGAVAFSACAIPEEELLVQSPVLMPEDLVSGRDNWFATLCRQCPEVEGIIVRVMEGRAKKVEGNPDYPTNRGKHSARCEAGLQAPYHPDRIPGPMQRVGERGTAQFQPIGTDEALDRLVTELKRLRDAGEADTVVLVTEPLRGHLALVVKRFMEAYGGQHMALEPLEHTVLRQTMRRVFGQEGLPDFDLENTRYLLSFGADFLSTWLAPVRFARRYGELRQGPGRRRGTLVQVESRFSMTAANADRWVPINPGMEGVLALSLAYVIIAEGRGDPRAAQAMTQGQGAQALEAFRPDKAGPLTGVAPERIVELAREFATKRPSLAIAGGSTAAQTNGLFNLSAIYALNFLVDSVGQKGGILFNPPSPIPEVPVTPQVSPFSLWQKLAERLQSGRPRPVKLFLVQGANPVYSLPAALNFREALAQVPFIVSFSSFMDETTAMADLILPNKVYLEDWGDDMPEPGPGYQMLGLQQPVVNPPPGYQPQSFADLLLTMAQELGPDMERALPWNTFRDVLREGARQLHRLNRGSVRAADFEDFWNGLLQRGGWWDVKARWEGGTPPPPRLPGEPVLPSFAGSERGFPFYLIPFESLSLGDGRGAHLPWLQATPDPLTTVVWQTWVEINARIAKELGIEEGDILAIESPVGVVEVPAYPHPAIPPQVVSLPLGQGHTFYGRYAQGRGVNPFSILAPITEAETGALAWAATRVRLRRTGRRIETGRIPKFEGVVPALQLPERELVQVTRG